MFQVHFGFQSAVHCVEKVLAVLTQMEAKQVIAEKAVEEFVLPGKCAEALTVGPRYMPELRDRQPTMGVFEHAGKKTKMVILNEDDRRTVTGLL